nr:Putative DNA-binding protein [Kibdelosporangium sp. MJ126-NF4]CTQ91987.1 Putative DNA-binding protein [Kibdelosporangium sp. MJ126-NF4]
MRELADMTQDEAGRRLHLALQKLSRIENGQLPGYHELRAMLRVYGVPRQDWDGPLELWELARERGWWRDFGLKDSGYVCMEHEAARLFEFHLGVLPPLMQTERYALASLQHKGDPETAVSIRLRRQQRLLGDAPLAVHSLIHEPVLHQGVDREQLRLLVERAQMANVTLQVVPQSAGLHGGLDGTVMLLSFTDPNEPDIVFTESPLGLAQSQEPTVTGILSRQLDRLAGLALPPDDSVDTIKALIW